MLLATSSAAQYKLPESGASLLNPKVQQFLKESGPQYGLSASDDGKLYYAQKELSFHVAIRILFFISQLPEGDVETAMTKALKLYLQPTLHPEQQAEYERLLFLKDAQGNLRLTSMGRTLLMDILTAEDGKLFKKSGPLDGKQKASRRKLLENMQKAGLIAFTALGKGAGLAHGIQGGTLFDGMAQGYYDISSFNWNSLEGAANPALVLGGFSYDEKKGTVRVLIAAKNPVQMDRYLVKDPSQEAPAIYQEAGLDASLMNQFGASVVRAVDNLIAVDVPIPQAAKLGKILEKQGINSRPALLKYLVTDALKSGPSWPDPFYGILPFPTGKLAMTKSGLPVKTMTVETMNADSRSMMGIEALHQKGMSGNGSIVGVMDTGLDLNHPDFKDRVLAFIDLSGESLKEPSTKGLNDALGHGTHTAGSVGGSGASSGGKYKGMAPDTKFVILKVFGSSGSTSEDTIIAAMKAAKALPQEIRPQVINMSLGGPGDPDTNPLSIMANEMMVQDNILMAIAAGNSGPRKGTVSSPGNARYVLTVTGVNKEGKFSFFPSRGPVKSSDGSTFNKPDISTIAGDVSFNQKVKAFFKRVISPSTQSLEDPQPVPEDPGCFYGPGVISARSENDPDENCALKGNKYYRFMSGTSMATPMAAGIAADVIGYLNEKGLPYKTTEVKAAMMETAKSLGEDSEVQGAGLVDGEKLAQAVEERVKAGLPVGNIAYMLAQRTTQWQDFNMQRDKRFRHTPIGILDTQTGHLVNTDEAYAVAAKWTEEKYKKLNPFAKAYRKLVYWIKY
ncbi:MAG: S8 family serine peptidase [Elusimicrobia bacterium]|nr:S8 family serine peptidase [Elusimicrobiota bacterium]